MRRWLAATALGTAAALAVGGCSGPAGVDRNLTDDWRPIAQPAVFVPEAGACLTNPGDAYLINYRPVDCDRPHAAETAMVGTFTGADADRATPPPAGSPTLRAARAECDKAANKLLGADWHAGRLALTVLVPRADAWTGGARWYRCELSETTSLDSDRPVSRTGGLAGALAAGSPLAHTCFNPVESGKELTSMTPVACTAPHHSEFAGVYAAPADMTYQSVKSDDRRIENWCLGVIATFAKIPTTHVNYRVGWIYYFPNEESWADGDHGIQCFLWDSDRTFNRTLKGAGTTALPVR